MIDNLTDNDVLEIRVHGIEWMKVDLFIFRSYTGQRRVNGESYVGPVYYLGTSDKAPDPVA